MMPTLSPLPKQEVATTMNSGTTLSDGDPADTARNNNVIITSKRRRNVVLV